MKIHLSHRTATRLAKAPAFAGLDVSFWPAEPGRVAFQVLAPNDPNGTVAHAAYKDAWRQTFRSRAGVQLD